VDTVLEEESLGLKDVHNTQGKGRVVTADIMMLGDVLERLHFNNQPAHQQSPPPLTLLPSQAVGTGLYDNLQQQQKVPYRTPFNKTILPSTIVVPETPQDPRQLSQYPYPQPPSSSIARHVPPPREPDSAHPDSSPSKHTMRPVTPSRCQKLSTGLECS